MYNLRSRVRRVMSTKGETQPLVEDFEKDSRELKRKQLQKVVLIVFCFLVVIVIVTITTVFSIKANSSSSNNNKYLFVHNAGYIYTVNPQQSFIDSFCVNTETHKITAIGNSDEVLNSGNCSKNAKKLDANGYYIFPGFHDSHAHLLSYGQQINQADLSVAKSIDDIFAILEDYYLDLGKDFKEGMWIRGWGWDQNSWIGWNSDEFPTRWMLDEYFEDIPVYLKRIDGHACWVNSAALNFSDLPDDNPEGGEIIRDENGVPTGVFIDYTDEENEEALKAVFAECSENGLTAVTDAGESENIIDIMLGLINNKKKRKYFTIRGNVMRSSSTDLPEYLQYRLEDTHNLLQVNSVKFYMDGALGSWGAAMLEPYCDKPNNTGIFRISEEAYYNNITAWFSNGYQINTHAIGDAANRRVIDYYELLLNATKSLNSDHRLRIEHAQIINLTDVLRCGKLGIIASMQPTHCTSDMVFAEDRLCKYRLEEAYPWKSFLDANISALPFGSDFPAVGVINPFLGLYAAITRQNESGYPIGGWTSNETVSIEQAIKGYTFDAAYGGFLENYFGTIEVNKFGDFIIVDSDILNNAINNPLNILNTSVIRTYLGGNQVYKNKMFKL